MMAEQQSKPNWLRYLLIGSLALNFVLAGLVGGAFISASKGPKGGDVARLAGPIIGKMPPDLRSKFRSEVFSRRGELLAIRNAVNEADIAVQAALIADPFDADAFDRALNARAEAIGNAIVSFNAPIMAVIGDLSLEEREALAATMEERRGRFGGSGPKKKHFSNRDGGGQ